MKLAFLAITVAAVFAAVASSAATTHKRTTFTAVEQFVHDIVQNLLFSSDDVFERAIHAGYADDALITANGIQHDKPSFIEEVRQIRADVSDRVFVDESFVLPSPPAADGAVAHITHFTAVVNDTAVHGNLVSVLLVQLVAEEQQSQIAIETFILGFE